MTDFSPAAQAVLDAFLKAPMGQSHVDDDLIAIAAALRAAADQVVPLSYEDVWADGRMLQYEKQDPVREKLLAIAAELEAAND